MKILASGLKVIVLGRIPLPSQQLTSSIYSLKAIIHMLLSFRIPQGTLVLILEMSAYITGEMQL